MESPSPSLLDNFILDSRDNVLGRGLLPFHTGLHLDRPRKASASDLGQVAPISALLDMHPICPLGRCFGIAVELGPGALMLPIETDVSGIDVIKVVLHRSDCLAVGLEHELARLPYH